VWTSEHTGETAASADRVFDLFKDVATWAEWNAGVERMELNGPFTAGTTGTMTGPGQDPLGFRLVWVDENQGFEDETEIPDAGVVVRVRHSLEPLPQGGTKITYRCVIEGPIADEIGPSLGSAITSDFPEVIAALATRASVTR
jgi:Polyketide cyclase / dehydrase and lipid transport